MELVVGFGLSLDVLSLSDLNEDGLLDGVFVDRDFRQPSMLTPEGWLNLRRANDGGSRI